MRRYLLVLPLLIACARADTPPADSAAAAPAALTDADIAGNWSGSIMPEGSDSVLATWTDACGGGTCRFVGSTAPNDTVPYTYTIAGDSLMWTSAAQYKDPQSGAMVTNSGAGRVSGGQLTGTGMVKLAQSDSVVLRYRVTGTKTP